VVKKMIFTRAPAASHSISFIPEILLKPVKHLVYIPAPGSARPGFPPNTANSAISNRLFFSGYYTNISATLMEKIKVHQARKSDS
jgi:hypothetical protein